MNEVTLIGRSGANAELKYLPNGMAVVNLSIATNEGKAEQKKTYWHRVTLFGKTAEIMGVRIRKGSEVFIRGKLRPREWEKDGVKQRAVDVIADWVRVMERHESNESVNQASGPSFSDDIPF